MLVLAIVLLAVVLRSRKKKGIEAEWHRAVVPALSDAQLARDAVLSDSAMSDDPGLRGAGGGPGGESRGRARPRSSGPRRIPTPALWPPTPPAALRGLAFAVEADRLLRHGASAPSGLQLAQADEARRTRNSELNAALSRLSTSIGSAPSSRRSG